jgi:hypothetical protein
LYSFPSRAKARVKAGEEAFDSPAGGSERRPRNSRRRREEEEDLLQQT